MANITQELNKIINAIFGRDVRQAIHDAIKKVYDDAAQNGNANMEVSFARGLFNTLAERLNSSDNRLNQTITESEFDSWVATLLDGGPSIFYDTFSALQADYPNGTAGIALVRETDPAKIYVWNGTKWEDFGDYQGLEVKDGTITTDKTNFLSVKELNLYNKNDPGNADNMQVNYA